jgi:hypothetical protein
VVVGAPGGGGPLVGGAGAVVDVAVGTVVGGRLVVVVVGKMVNWVVVGPAGLAAAGGAAVRQTPAAMLTARTTLATRCGEPPSRCTGSRANGPSREPPDRT